MDHFGRLWLLKNKSHIFMFTSPAPRAFDGWQNNFFSWPNSKISLHYTVLHQPRDPSVHRRSHEISAGIGRRKCLIMWLQAGSWCIHTKLYRYRQRNPDIFWIVTSIFLESQMYFYLLWMEYSTKVSSQWQKNCKFFPKTLWVKLEQLNKSSFHSHLCFF